MRKIELLPKIWYNNQGKIKRKEKFMNKKQRIIILMLIIGLIIIDQIIKITYTKTQGINIEKTSDNMSYILISIMAIIILVRYILNNNSFIKMDSRIILSFAIAGATSNVIDRFCVGNVINNIKIPSFIDINLSYIYILITWIGMAIVLTRYTVNQIKEKKKSGNKNNNSPK